MGGNGSYILYANGGFENYKGDRFTTVGYIGEGANRVEVVQSTAKKRDGIPVNSFSSDMYYVTDVDNPNRITKICFYDKKNHLIKKEIELQYDSHGNLKPYAVTERKGKLHTSGLHGHNWFEKEHPTKGKIAWRTEHDKNNIFEVSKSDMKYVKRALKYNEEHKK